MVMVVQGVPRQKHTSAKMENHQQRRRKSRTGLLLYKVYQPSPPLHPVRGGAMSVVLLPSILIASISPCHPSQTVPSPHGYFCKPASTRRSLQYRRRLIACSAFGCYAPLGTRKSDGGSALAAACQICAPTTPVVDQNAGSGDINFCWGVFGRVLAGFYSDSALRPRLGSWWYPVMGTRGSLSSFTRQVRGSVRWSVKEEGKDRPRNAPCACVYSPPKSNPGTISSRCPYTSTPTPGGGEANSQLRVMYDPT